jgi:opacity protein-like surface antigen
MKFAPIASIVAYRSLAALALFATACSSVPSRASLAGPQDGAAAEISSLNVLLGKRQLGEDDWAPVDEPGVLGLEYANERAGSAVGYEIGFSFAAAEEDEFVAGLGDVELSSGFFEVYGGLRKTFFADAGVRPYLGLGVTVIAVALEAESGGLSSDDDDASFGGYAHGGLEFRVTDNFRLGLDLRAVFGTDVELFGVSGDADYEQLALVAGFSI